MQMNEIKRTIMALASTPEVQDKLFPDFSCKGDELVLEFDEAFENAKLANKITNEQLIKFNILNNYFSEHSGKEFEKLYTDNDAIYNKLFWAEVRVLAQDIIRNMGWNYEIPNISNSVYIGNSM